MNFYACFQCFWSPEGRYQAAGSPSSLMLSYDSLLGQAQFLHFPQGFQNQESAGDPGAHSSCEVEPTPADTLWETFWLVIQF